MVRMTRPVARSIALGKYDGSPMTMGASATAASAPEPERTPAAVPSSLKSTSSTAVLSMKVPPWMAHSREKPSGSPPRP